jgi:hypothetical protein
MSYNTHIYSLQKISTLLIVFYSFQFCLHSNPKENKKKNP